MSTPVNVLAITYAFPPYSFPRSIQISRLVAASNCRFTMICADDPEAKRDETIMPGDDTGADTIIRVPYTIGFTQKVLRRLSHNLGFSFFLMQPDQIRFWHSAALPAIRKQIETNRPDIVVTFGMPMSDHLLGLTIRKEFNLPWLAHFSDPWVDNPYLTLSPFSKWNNKRYESAVMHQADSLVFTNEESLDLIMQKYPAGLRVKAHVLGHSFDPVRYPDDGVTNRGVVRHLGALYGLRTPAHFLEALKRISRNSPSLLAGVRFEFIGPVEERLKGDMAVDGLDKSSITFHDPVDYQESLDLMASAQGLLLVDAPMESSPFFPSKLADYIGAKRPILALTPPGPARRIVDGLPHGFTASPNDDDSITAALKNYLLAMQSKTKPSYDGEYKSSRIASRFDAIVTETITRSETTR